ncbi:WXG100 family type VII secretion target [Nocardioides sp. TRM66260-LWL]|uniref:WXG100 family type VII secretion target n=1 Tax=Nocardioides sp. TRM66260-LWL TaxID=2874478 RepID=UPI001CC3AA1C|nr:WXG100 family type VII secretion target [Nocardioides sp. TRM66260-LWL]MBZ5736053.1 WXG100 family type VII secretion target [Nocardioides sp. TRM66260-LWL]
MSHPVPSLPSGGDLVVGEHALSRAATLVTAAHHDLVAIGRGLEADVETLRSHWSGAGATAFQALARAWSERHARVVAALDGLEAGLRSTEQQVTEADQQQAASLAALHSALG